jgi:orotate phosphoribosyltransferase
MRRHALDVHVPDLEPVLLRVYDLAIFESYERTFKRPGSSRRTTWGLDLRRPLCRGELLGPIAAELASGIERSGIGQVAGYGFGAYPLVGAVVAVSPALVGGFVRPKNKPYGFGERVEGALDPSQPVALLDDLLGSGRAALNVARVLREAGLEVAEVHTVFALGFRRGTSALGEEGLAHRCLATLWPDPAFQVPRELQS